MTVARTVLTFAAILAADVGLHTGSIAAWLTAMFFAICALI